MSKNRKKLKLSAVMALFPLLFTTIPGIAETVIFDSQVQELVLNDGDVLTGTLESNCKIKIANGATVTLNGVSINANDELTGGCAGITCLGNATIVLADGTVNTVKGMKPSMNEVLFGYSGILPGGSGTTLTIRGTGTLNAIGQSGGAGIGAYQSPCGNIVIEGGIINATGGENCAGIGSGEGYQLGNPQTLDDIDYIVQCGDITITGGTVTAIGNGGAAGIGTGMKNSTCGNITITNGAISVTATKGTGATNFIGASGGTGCSSGTVTIDGVENATYESTFTNFASIITNDYDTWKLTNIYHPITLSSLPDGVTGTVTPEKAKFGDKVTISFEGIPDGMAPELSITYRYGDSDYNVFFENEGNGTYSFSMENSPVTVSVSLKKDINSCTATVPDQSLGDNSYIFYKFESANYGNVTIGEEVYDGNTKLTLKTDYEFGSVKYLDGTSGTAKTNEPGEEMLVEIKGIGNYAGSKWVNFMITTPDESGEWGDLTWNLHEGTLTINKKDGVEGNVVMNSANQGVYPWFQYGQYITSISIGEGVSNIAKNAFAGSHNVNTYGNVKSVSFPSTLTKIGEDAFAYCTGATIDIDQIITIFKNNNSGIENIDPTAFYQVRCVSCTMESSDNTAIIGLISGTQTANVTINGRTLKKDGSWNTLCLPFDIDLLAKNDNDEYICPLNGAVIMEMDDTSDGTNFDSGTGVLKLKFKSIIGNEMTHGKPYLVKWTKPDGYDDNPASFDIVDPTFTGVTNIGNNLTVVTSKDGSVTFNGTYLPYTGSVEALLKESDNSTALDAFHAFVKVYDKSTYIVEGVYEDEQFQTSANTLKELDHDNIMKYYAKINEAAPVVTYYVDENGTTHNVDAYELEESRTTLTTGTYVVNRDITFENTVKLNGDVTLILSDGHKMQIGKTGQNLFDGIVFEGENDESLTIYGQSDGTGKLVIDIVKENGYCIAANNISINSGTVDVKNLGSGYDIYGNDVQIKGGQVNATGSMENIYSNGPLTISGGTVTVASIAPGSGNLTCVHAQNITISGGIVNIIPSDKTLATYIGLNSEQNIIISGGLVTVNTNTNNPVLRSIYAPNGTITLGYTRSDDFVWANSYSAVTIAQGKTMSDGTDTYSGALGYGTIDGKTMRPYKDDLSLAVDADNTQSINGWNGGITNVTLTGLTLYKDGKWHTLCLPFDVKDSDYDPDKVWYNVPGGYDEITFTGSPLEGCTLMELDNEGFYDGNSRYTYDEGKGGYYDEDGYDYGGVVAELRHTGLNTDGTLRLCFIKAYEIKAGKPYLIKWDSGENIENPIFSKVLINNTVDDNVVSQDGEVMFVGSYKPYVSTGDAFLTDADVSKAAFHAAIIAPQRTGYVFGGWFAEPGYNNNNTVNEISLSENNSVELYPLWTLITGGNCGQTGIDGSDVTWSYDESSKTITISGTGAMMYYGLTDDYNHSTSPWSHFDDVLEHVVINDGVTSVGAYAFAMCSKLTDVVLPASVFQIDQAAFYTSSLNRIIIPRTEAVSVAQYAFDNCPEGLSIVVPSTLLKTYKNADNWSTYSDKLVGSLSEVTGFNATDFVSGRYEFKRTFKCGVSSTICLPFAVPVAQAASVGKFYSFDGIDKSGQQWTVIMKEDVNEVTNGLEANKPYLFVPYIFDGMSHGDAFEFTFSGSVSSPDVAGSVIKQENKNGSFWTFQGVFYNILWDETHNSGMLGKVYGFAANSYSPDDNSYTVNPGDFVKAGEGASIPSFRAFLQYTGSSAQGAPMRGGTRADVSLPNSIKVKLIDANGTITATGEISTETADFIIDTWYDMNGHMLPDAPTTPGIYIHNGNQVLIKY